MSTSRPPSDIVARDGRIYHLGLAPEEIAPNLVLVGDPARAELVAERFDAVEHRVAHREFVTLTGTYHGIPISVIGTGIGTDNVEIAVVEAHTLLTYDLGTRAAKPAAPRMTIIRVGTSGGLREDVAPGTLAIARYAVGLDATGLFFDAPPADATVVAIEEATRRALAAATPAGRRFAERIAVYAAAASPAVVEALEHALADGTPALTGITATAPGFYGASGRVLGDLALTIPGIKQALGAIEVEGRRAINVEMESSLLFHLAACLGHRAGTICAILSSPGSHGTVVDGRPGIARSIEAALAAMVRLAAAP